LLQPVVTHALFYLSLANLDFLNALSIDCLAGYHVNYYITTTFRAMIPMLVIAVLLVVYYGVPRMRRKRSAATAAALDAHLEAYQRDGAVFRVCLFVAFLCYPSVTRQCAQFFFCERVADEWYLEADFTVRCFTPLWYWYTAPIVLWLLLYGAGIPVAVFVLLYRYRHQFDLRFIHSSYRDELYWWDCTEYARKLLLLLLSVNWWWLSSVTDSPLATLSLAVSFVALSVHLSVLPFRSSQDHWFQTVELSGVCLFYLWLVDSNTSYADTLAWMTFVFASVFCVISLGLLLVKVANRFELSRRLCGFLQKNAASQDERAHLLK